MQGGVAVASRRRLIWGFIIAMFVLFTLVSRAGSTYVNYLWFVSLGYVSVFWRVLTARLWVGGIGGAAFALYLFANLAIVRPSFEHLPPDTVPGHYARWLRPGRLLMLMAVVSGVVGLLAGWSLSGQWPTVLRYLNHVPFGVREPLFHRDVGFYVFELPFFTLVYQTAGFAFVLTLLAVLGAYFLTGFINYYNGRLHVHPRARAHVAILAGLYLLLKGSGYVLDSFNLVYSQRGVVFGASYADVHAALPALRILTGVAVILAALAFANALANLVRPLIGGVVAMVALSLLLGTIYPSLVEEFVVKPSELQREQPYIADNIALTRAAYDLGKVQAQTFTPESDLSAASVARAADTTQNVRLWSEDVAQADFEQQQGLRAYYTFDPTTVDRYTIDGRYRQTLLSAREINYSALPEPTWQNVHMKYTHGYGAVMIPAAAVGPEGLPQYWLSDFPPTSPVGLQLTRPQIYYGDQNAPYALVDTNTPEFDYPVGQDNAYSQYSASTGGIPVGPLLNRAAFALYEGNYNILFTSNVTPQTKALIHRDVVNRVERIAPFLRYESSGPYLVVYDGGLQWILDAYTESSYYPYSEPAPGESFNYMRNSVKVVVDAYTGQATFYVADPSDPIIQVYERIFPQLFRPLSAMPAGLRQHIRYPQDIFEVQTNIYAKYHMTDPTVFYNREDLWTPATEIVGTSQVPFTPYYVIIQLPGQSKPEFLEMEPFTPYQRNNMVAWVAARSDAPHYGDLIAYEFPKGALTLGPLQVDATINQDPEIASDLALWSQQGSHVERGRLLVVPVQNSLLYVEPIYQTATGAQLPELRRVIVAYGSQIGFQPTLDQALQAIFGAGAAPPANVATPATATAGATASATAAAGPAATGSAATGSAALAQQAEATYQQAVNELRQGNFAAFGQDLQKLGTLLSQLAAAAH
jgi:uncharacterized membrane protein (UPF0182 family)